MKFDYIVGNPPYIGKGSVAVAILNKLYHKSNLIKFVVPRTFTRYRTLNSIRMKLIQSYDNPNDTFGGIIYTVTQTFSNTGKCIKPPKPPLYHPDFKLTKFDVQADFHITRHEPQIISDERLKIKMERTVVNIISVWDQTKDKTVRKTFEKIDFVAPSKKNSTMAGFLNNGEIIELYQKEINEI